MEDTRSSGDSSAAAPEPAELCGYPVERALVAGQTYLARGEGGRVVVLKRMDADCLLGKGLHPSIVDRLSRVRELAHTGVANLYGVGRGGDRAGAGSGDVDAAGPWLIWEYVAGETLLRWAAGAGRTSRDLLVMAREVILGVDSLHRQGIVHGSLVEGNVIVGPDGGVRLTHVSPLLYTDMHVDVESVVGLLDDMVGASGEAGQALGRVLLDWRRAEGQRVGGVEVSTTGAGAVEDATLRRLGARVAGVLEAGAGAGGNAAAVRDAEAGKGIRRWTIVQAVLAGAAGLALAYGVWRAFAS